jgi:hypothetical protein
LLVFGIPSPPILILDSFENHCLDLAHVEPLVGFDLLPQLFHLALGGMALGFPQARSNIRGALLTGQFGERALKVPDLRLRDSAPLFVLDHFCASVRRAVDPCNVRLEPSTPEAAKAAGSPSLVAKDFPLTSVSDPV